MAGKKCPKCGKYKSRKEGMRNGLQRYLCTNPYCGKYFTEVKRSRKARMQTIRNVLHLFLEGYQSEKIAELMGVSKETAETWRDKYLRELKNILPEVRTSLLPKDDSAKEIVYLPIKGEAYGELKIKLKEPIDEETKE